jgi:RHS repeat-associated protein
LANTKKTVQSTQYYPSGLPWASIASDSTGLQERKYNGKEFVEMHGYDTYDYGARGYYAAMGRFICVDPLAEMDYSVSPYAYCGDNPINRIDPDGRSQAKTEYIENVIDLQTGEITRSSQSLNTEKVHWEKQPIYIAADANKSDKTTKNDNDNSKSLGTALVIAVDAVGEAITASEVLIAGVMAAVVICPGDTPLDHKKEYHLAPADLKGFPGATKVKPKAGRPRWHLPNGDIAEWDSQHGEVEVYDKTGKKHKGAYDPKSGEKKKDGDPKRKTEPK